MSRQYVVIGLGRVGGAMIETLLSLGHDVLGIDSEERLVQDLADECPEADLVTADATDQSVLKNLDVAQFDGAVVLIGENIEASILAVANLKEVGVSHIAARASSALHARILSQIGADRVIEIEREMGRELAYVISSSRIREYVNLGEDEALIEAEIPEDWAGKSLADLDLSRKRGLSVVAVKPEGGPGRVPSGDTVLRKGDLVVVGGSKQDLNRSSLLGRER